MGDIVERVKQFPVHVTFPRQAISYLSEKQQEMELSSQLELFWMRRCKDATMVIEDNIGGNTGRKHIARWFMSKVREMANKENKQDEDMGQEKLHVKVPGVGTLGVQWYT